jgi:hypothetical protein
MLVLADALHVTQLQVAQTQRCLKLCITAVLNTAAAGTRQLVWLQADSTVPQHLLHNRYNTGMLHLAFCAACASVLHGMRWAAMGWEEIVPLITMKVVWVSNLCYFECVCTSGCAVAAFTASAALLLD